MKREIGLSLITLLALSASTINAQPLSEAIQNVDVSGTVVYRYNDYKDDVDSNNSATNQYKVAINLKSKVTNDVIFNSRFIAANTSAGTDKTRAKLFGTSTEGDSNLDLTLSAANFTYTGLNNLVVTVGKQGISSPWTKPRMVLGKEQTGTGINVQYNVGSTTLSAAYFNQTNFDKAGESYTFLQNSAGSDFMMAGLTSNIGPVSFDAYYGTVKDLFDVYTIGLKGKFDFRGIQFSPFARYSSLDVDENKSAHASAVKGTQELWQLGGTLRTGIYKLFAAYGETGNDGGLVFVDYTSSAGMDYHWRVTANKDADAKYTYVHTTADITPKITAGIFYSKADKKEVNKDVSEVYGQVVYKMSKNLLTYVRYGVLDDESIKNDGTMGRLHIKYSF